MNGTTIAISEEFHTIPIFKILKIYTGSMSNKAAQEGTTFYESMAVI